MRFKSKDLMVSVSPNVEIDREAAAKLCLGGSRICIRPTLDPCIGITWWGCDPCTFRVSCACTIRGSWGCGAFNSCGPDRSTCDPTIFCQGASIWEIENPEDLVTLRDELKGLIRQLDTLEAEGLPSQFNTRDQADAAEQALESALEEVRRQKKNL
jgi:hypothetical protein